MTEHIEDLTRALDAVMAAQEPPGGLIQAVRAELRDATANSEWRARLWAAQKTLVPFVDACLAAGMTREEMNGRLATIGAEIKRPGKSLTISFRGGAGDFLQTKPERIGL